MDKFNEILAKTPEELIIEKILDQNTADDMIERMKHRPKNITVDPKFEADYNYFSSESRVLRNMNPWTNGDKFLSFVGVDDMIQHQLSPRILPKKSK